MAFAKLPASKSPFIQRHLKDAVDLDALKADILNFPHGEKLQDGDPDSLVQLRKIIERHAPEEFRIITLRPHAPWFDSELRKLKREKRRYKRANKTSGLEIHKQIYKDQCRQYTRVKVKVKVLYIYYWKRWPV